MPEQLVIRTATAADAELLAAIGRETFCDTFAPDNTPEDMAAYLQGAFGPEQQARELADPDGRFLVAEAGGQPAGYAYVHQGAAPEGVGGQRPMEIVRIYARRAWIGKGVGARLMRACLEAAAEAGCDVIWLGVWERNPRAIEFYHRWGFAEAGAHEFWLGADKQRDLLMARRVNLDEAARSIFTDP